MAFLRGLIKGAIKGSSILFDDLGILKGSSILFNDLSFKNFRKY